MRCIELLEDGTKSLKRTNFGIVETLVIFVVNGRKFRLSPPLSDLFGFMAIFSGLPSGIIRPSLAY